MSNFRLQCNIAFSSQNIFLMSRSEFLNRGPQVQDSFMILPTYGQLMVLKSCERLFEEIESIIFMLSKQFITEQRATVVEESLDGTTNYEILRITGADSALFSLLFISPNSFEGSSIFWFVYMKTMISNLSLDRVKSKRNKNQKPK